MTHDTLGAFNRLKSKACRSYWEKRILSQTAYLIELLYHKDPAAKNLLDQAVSMLVSEYEQNEQISVEKAKETELFLQPLSEQAKSITVICAAHAHIDMNWMWGYQETVNVTLDTMRTMLTLMNEYPQYTFSQSQASVYRILEQYAPDMLEQVKQRIKEGRWEVTASSWVENDKNMSGGESLARHLLYTKQYLSRLLEISEDSLTLDFEPDTFGHSYNLPEILQNGGVSRYYQCRGYDGEHIYRWKGISGAEILVYREPMWYNAYIDSDMFGILPELCEKYGISKVMKVYGVGDHGGGPTRRDLNLLLDMSEWPLLPRIKFGTFREFFDYLETQKEKFPVVNQELNCVFTGCYTSQSRIKMANHIGENRLAEAEFLESIASLEVPGFQRVSDLEEAWRKILFNQFHDILPGSGTVETREYALGQFQKAMAQASANASHAMYAICDAISDSSAVTLSKDIVMGAGVGSGTGYANGYGFSLSERGSGSIRHIALFNAAQRENTDPVELYLWDWNEDLSCTRISDLSGKEYPMQILEKGVEYGGHRYHKLLAWIPVPALGYTVCKIDTKPAACIDVVRHVDILCDNWITDEPICLENDRIKALFDPSTMKCISLIRKADQQALITPDKPGCGLLLITEENSNSMTSWRVGRTAAAIDLNSACAVKPLKISLDGLRKELCYQLDDADGSKYTVSVSLDEGSEFLKFTLNVIWTKLGGPEKGIPQLRFQVPCGYPVSGYRYTIPSGVIDRPAMGHDVPALGAGCALPVGEVSGNGCGYVSAEAGAVGGCDCAAAQAGTASDGCALALLCDTKYGFRGDKDGLSLNLIRSSYDPDPYPEIGAHIIRLAVGACDPSKEALALAAEQFFHPVISRSCAGAVTKQLSSASLLKAEGAVLSAVKLAQDGRGLIVRVYNPESCEKALTLALPGRKPVFYRCDILEHDLEKLCAEDDVLLYTMRACEVCTFRLVLEDVCQK